MSYEAVVYVCKHKYKDMFYVGHHKTTNEYDNYSPSSTDFQFQDEYTKGNITHPFVIFRGTLVESVTAEHLLLKYFDAVNNDKFYNKSNGGGSGCVGDFSVLSEELKNNLVRSVKQFINNKEKTSKETYSMSVSFDEVLVESVFSKITSGGYEIVEGFVEELFALPRIQVRQETLDHSHMSSIKERMIDNPEEARKHIEPIIVVVSGGEKRILNGNHTITAAYYAGWKKVDVIYVDSKDLGNSISNIEHLGQKYNHVPKLRKGNTTEDLRRSLVLLEIELLKESPFLTMESEYFKRKALSRFSGLYAKRTITEQIKKVSAKAKEEKENIKHNFTTYTKDYIKNVRNRVELEYFGKGYAVISIDSNSLHHAGLGAINNKMNNSHGKKMTKGIILISYANIKSYHDKENILNMTKNNISNYKEGLEFKIMELNPKTGQPVEIYSNV